MENEDGALWFGPLPFIYVEDKEPNSKNKKTKNLKLGPLSFTCTKEKELVYGVFSKDFSSLFESLFSLH